MSEPWKNDEEEEEDEEDVEDSNYKSDKDAVLFAIDVSRTMLTKPPPSDSKKPDTDSPVAAALKCAYQIMQQRIISNPKDMMGVLLFGTEQSKFQDDTVNSRGGLQYPHCYLLNDLDIPAAEDVKALKAMVEDDEVSNKLLIPSEEPVTMSNLLFCANQIFTTKAPSFGSRRLFIITDNDDPHVTDKNARSQAAVRAKDLYDLGVIIELFPISHSDHEFDRSKFYDDVIYRDPNETDGMAQMSFKSAGQDGISLLNNLISDINSKQVAKRSLFSNMPFEIGPGFKISVKGYNIVQKQKPARSCFVYLGGERAQVATSKTEKLAEETRPVDKVEIKKAYKFGGEVILFTPEEQKEMKDFGPSCIRIIGFKPQSLLPHWASVNKSTFIYPSEEDYVGSTRVFSALWQKLLKDEKMGIAWYIARKNATPTLVAILPSKEKLDDYGGQLIPQGLWLYPLPTADDLRNPPDCPSPIPASDDLITEMRRVIQQLQLPKATYNPFKYPNPALQWHYKIVQALALEEELPDKPDDKTIPKYKQIHKRAGEYIHNWGIILEEEARAHEEDRRGGLKREGPNDAGPPKKKTKGAKEGLGEMSAAELKSAVANETVGRFTVSELKEFCQLKGLAISGKKSDLVERIEQWVEGSI